jgi:hypothetical protein
VYLGVGENAASGYIVVYTAICNEMLDSVVVSVKSLYSENKGIHPFDREETACFVIGEEALFYIEADPTVESYKWVFPEEWGIEDSLITNPFDTVVNVIIGNTTGVITVTGVACDITWERSYEISRFSPVLPKSIILDGKSCVNKGLADTVTLIATGSKEVSSFIWNYPSMWTVLESFDSTIRLLTNKDVKGEYQVALEVENQCERSSDIVSIIISQNGIGLPLTFTYALGPPVNTRVIMTVNPSNNNLYDYKWYIYSDFDTVKSSNFSYPVSKQDTATNTYCVTVTDNATGCSSMECTKPIIADIDTISRDSITVEITQPETVSRSKSNNDSEETLMDLAEYSFSDLAENNNEEEVIEESKNEFYFENTDNFIVSPNPARDHINILLEKDADYIEILNINGMTVYRKKCISRNFELSVNNLQSGLYIVKVTFNGIVKTKKLQVVK